MLCNAAIERMETEMRELKSVFESEDEEADFSVIVSEPNTRPRVKPKPRTPATRTAPVSRWR